MRPSVLGQADVTRTTQLEGTHALRDGPLSTSADLAALFELGRLLAFARGLQCFMLVARFESQNACAIFATGTLTACGAEGYVSAPLALLMSALIVTMLNLMNLGALPMPSNARTRSISAENSTGEGGGGAGAEVPSPEMIAAMLESMKADLPPNWTGHPLPRWARAGKQASASWYQSEPHVPFPDLPPVHECWTR